MLYGKPSDSTGALLSGMFNLEVLDDMPFPMKSVHLTIIQEVHTVKPHSGNCKNCLNRVTELARWDVLQNPADLPKASHAYPFSHLIPGTVPATTSNSVFKITYRLTAVAIPDNDKHKIIDPNRPSTRLRFPNFEISLPLNIKRSIIRVPDRSSVRVFPPTDIVANITLPSSVYPNSTFPLELVVEGVSMPITEAKQTLTRWGLRKLTWRIDENAKIRTFRCPAHQHVPLSRYTTGASSKTASAAKLASRACPPTMSPMTGASRGSGSTPVSMNGSPAPSPAVVESSANAPSNASANSSSSTSVVALASAAASIVSVTPQVVPQSPAVAASLTPALVPSSPAADAIAQESPIPLDPPPPAPEEFFIEETRLVASGEVKSGWKSDYFGKGKIELSTELSTGIGRVACDIGDPTFGLHTSHLLILEIVVMEEAILMNPNRPSVTQVMPTGSARILRMQFKLNLTERSGLGISWDDEVPPVYDDVPMSPPHYDNIGSGSGRLPAVEDVVLTESGEIDAGYMSISGRLNRLDL